jgi:cation diffusion facilitator CzcD-associated flavoprotein CzcO
MISENGAGMPHRMNVAIVGAGPAGLGVARVLRDIGVPDVWVLERGQVGQSFFDWPAGTRLLTPSFPANTFGLTDLNAISYDSSPGWSLKREHPDGAAYAQYLKQAAMVFGLDVQCGVEVSALEPQEQGLAISTSVGEIHANFVIWACGQFNTPSDGGIEGATLARHYAEIPCWQSISGDEVFVVGGYESGIDAAVGLASVGKRVTVLGRDAHWLMDDKDPSRALSPYTRQRLDATLAEGQVALVEGADVVAMEREAQGIRLFGSDGRSWLSPDAPVLATGFASGTKQVSSWFEYDDTGLPMLTPQDESTTLPGLFLVGPEVAHGDQLFCFIYKFRQRFAVVANAIAGRLGVDTSALEVYRACNMYLDDLTCCEDDKCFC